MHTTLGSSEVAWAGKTAQEVREVATANGSTLIIPIGSVEQHGTHLPVATDTILVDAVAHAGAERVQDEMPILVTPTIWHGFSPHHMSFGGGITLEFDDMMSIIEEVAESAIENGFERILLVNGHGGNIQLVGGTVKTIGQRFPEATIHGLTYFHLGEQFIDDVRDSAPGGMSHGGEFETSLMLHLRPELVRTDQIQGTSKEVSTDYESTDMMNGGVLGTYRTFDEYSESGAIGDPDLATAEKGEVIFEHLGDEMERLLGQLHDLND